MRVRCGLECGFGAGSVLVRCFTNSFMFYTSVPAAFLPQRLPRSKSKRFVFRTQSVFPIICLYFSEYILRRSLRGLFPELVPTIFYIYMLNLFFYFLKYR